MRFKNNIGFMLVMAFILLLTVSLVSASEVDSDVGVISNDNELLASNVGYVENGVPSDLNLKSTENVEMDDSGILSSNQADSLGEDGIDDDPIDYHDANRMKFIPSENPIVSEENYSVIFDWVHYGRNRFAPNSYYEKPWLMNDTTWANCIEPGPSGPDGYYYGAPGVYKRITLTDEQLIHPITGEDVLPYIRTFLYYHYNDTENFTTVSSGKVSFPNVLWAFTDSQDYNNPESYYNRQPYSNPSWTYVKEAIDRVKSGNGIPNSGSFHDTGLTYQFYLYSSINGHYQNILGFNLFTNISVIKEWDDNDNVANLRPDNISVDLYSDGEPIIRGVTLDSNNNWEYTFNNLPLYSISNLTAPINPDDYEIKTILEDDFDLTIKKVWPDDYSNKPSRISVNIYADGENLGSVPLDRSNDYTLTLTNFNKYAEDGHEINYEVIESSTYPGSLDIIKSEIYQVKHIKVSLTNDELKQAGKSIELVSDGLIYGGAILEEANDWTYTFLNLDKDSNVDIRERLDSNGVVHLANYTIKESEVRYYLSSVSSNSTSINPLMPSKTKFFDDTEEKITSSIKITNKLELINLTVSKVWEDKGDFYGKRPSDVTINVFKNGEIVNSIVLNKDNGWKFELKNLPKYDNGKLINYSIDEVNITYYHYKIEENGDYSFTVTNTLNKVHVLKWSWKLIAKKESNKGNFSDKNKLGNGKKIGKYQSKNVISNKNKKSSSWDKNQRKHSGRYFDSGQEFKLFIFLYNQYFFGNMTYEDFVAVLKENGIELEESNNWDSNGTLEFDYGNIDDVPDSIELSDNSNHFKDSSDEIDKEKPVSDSGVIDSGDVEVEEVYVEE